MTRSPSADQFVYTAAAFGHAGSEGFQFVGLPGTGAGEAEVEMIERHLSYTPPIDAQSAPDDPTIAADFPVSVRLLYPNAGERAALIASRYAGRTYRSAGERGKWGNFFVHAFLLDSDADPRSLARLALAAPWRLALTPQEHEAAQALDLPALDLPAGAEPGPTASGDRELLAALLTRLCGGPPTLLLGLPHRAALEQYARVQALLPPVLLRRLAWSSYEFDGASGYDVVATEGRTQLSLSPAGYVQPGVTALGADMLWAADQARAAASDFWALIALVAGPAMEGASLKAVIATLRSIDEAPSFDARRTHEVFEVLRQGPAQPESVQAARRLFEQSFRQERLQDFPVLASAYAEAKAFAAWSGDPAWAEALEELASRSPPLLACFSDPGDAGLLTSALDAACAAGLAPEKVARIAIDAAGPHLRAGREAARFHQALHGFLACSLEAPGTANAPRDGSAKRWSALLSELVASPEHEVTAQALVRMQAGAAGGRWLDAVEPDLRRAAGQQASAWLSDLLATLIVETYAERANELAWRVRALERVDATHLQARMATKAQLPAARWFERLDSDIVQLHDAALRTELARRLTQAHERWPAATQPEEKSIVNSLCLSIANKGEEALALAGDPKRFERLCGPAAPAAYAAVAQAAWAASPASHIDPAQARKLFERLWRRDVADEFAERVLAQVDAALSRNGNALGFVRAALSAPRGNGHAAQAWQELLRRLTLKIAPRLKDAEFEALAALPQIDPRLREQLCSRRSFSLRGVHEKLGKLAHRLVGRFGKH